MLDTQFIEWYNIGKVVVSRVLYYIRYILARRRQTTQAVSFLIKNNKFFSQKTLFLLDKWWGG